MVMQLFDTMIEASSDKEWLQPIHQNNYMYWKLVRATLTQGRTKVLQSGKSSAS